MMLKFENLAKEFTDTNSSAVTSFIVNILRATFYWLRAFRRTPFLVSSCFHLHNHSTDFTCFGKSWQNKFQFIVLEGRGYGQENFSELSTQITYIYIYIYICSNFMFKFFKAKCSTDSMVLMSRHKSMYCICWKVSQTDIKLKNQ